MKLDRIGVKLLVLCLSFTLPIAVMLYLMVNAKNKDIDFAVWEKYGDTYQRPLEQLFQDVSRHRWLTVRFLHGEVGLAGDIAKFETAIDQDVAKVIAVNNELSEPLQFTADGLGKRKRTEFTAANFQKSWDTLKAGMKTITVTASEEAHGKLIDHIKTMITHMGDTSNLILDPDLDSYYLMDVTLLALPQMQGRVQEMVTFFEKMLKKGSMTQEERLQASVYASFLKEADMDRVSGSSQTSLNEDANFYGVSESLQKNIAPNLKQLGDFATDLIERTRAFANASDLKKFDVEGYRKSADTVMTSVYKYHFLALDEMDNLLNARLESFHASMKRGIIWTLLSLVASSLLAFWIASNMLRRVKGFIAVTKAISGGNMGARVEMQGNDELAELANSFDNMTGNIQTLNAEIASKNESLKNINQNLENIVAERTATIKTILDNVKFGFLLVNRDLRIEDGFSKSCVDLLGNGLKAGSDFFSVCPLGDERNRPLAKAFMEQAFEDFLPIEMTLQQIPQRFNVGDKVLSTLTTPVRDAKGNVKSILFTIIDATELERAERDNQRHKILVRLLKEMDAFKNFLEETKTRIALCRKFVLTGDQAKVRAELHTIKGNTSAFDLIDIAKLIHGIEDAHVIQPDHVDRIESAVTDFLESNFEVLQLSYTSETEDTYQISKAQLLDVLAKVQKASTKDLLESALTTWVGEIQAKPARTLVGALPDYAERLAARLAKTVKVSVTGGEVKMDPEFMRPVMQSLVHLVRNAIDHGIETEDQRGSKDSEGRVTIACGEGANFWSVDVRDDGKGIDGHLICVKAIEAGAITKAQALAMTEKEKFKLIFMSGISTAESVSDISGRGVGMAAVEAAVKDSGGSIDIESQLGKGTLIKIRIPKPKRDGLQMRKAS